MFFKRFLTWMGWAAATLMLAQSAQAGIFELSALFQFQRSKFDDGSFTRTRGYRGSLAWHFSEVSSFEIFYQTAQTRTMIVNGEDTTYDDQFFGVNWVQSLFPKTFPFQPYFKAGVGQLNRKISASVAGAHAEAKVDSVTVNGAIGARILLSERVAIKTEVETVLVNGKISSVGDNITFLAGASFFF